MYREIGTRGRVAQEAAAREADAHPVGLPVEPHAAGGVALAGIRAGQLYGLLKLRPEGHDGRMGFTPQEHQRHAGAPHVLGQAVGALPRLGLLPKVLRGYAGFFRDRRPAFDGELLKVKTVRFRHGAERADAPVVLERQLHHLADLAPRVFLTDGPRVQTKRPRVREYVEVGSSAGIICGKSVELPLLSGDPCHVTSLDVSQVCNNEFTSLFSHDDPTERAGRESKYVVGGVKVNETFSERRNRLLNLPTLMFRAREVLRLDSASCPPGGSESAAKHQ